MSKRNGKRPEVDDPLVVSIDQEIEAEVNAMSALDAQRAEHQKRLRSLRSARKALVKKARPASTLSPRKIAGPKVIRDVYDLLAGGPLPQAEITRRLDVNSGSISYAIKALIEDKAIRDTGEKEKGSRVFGRTDRSIVYPR